MLAGRDSIDAFVQALIFGGSDGWDFIKGTGGGTFFTNQTTHHAYTWLDITGAGLLVGIALNSTADVSIQIDGQSPFRRYANLASGKYHLLMVPFKTSLKISSSAPSDSSPNQAIVQLIAPGDKWSARSLVTTLSSLTYHQTYTLADVSGAGVFLGASTHNSGPNTIGIEVDNSGVVYVTGVAVSWGLAGFGIPFKTRLKVSCSAPDARILYHLD